MSTFSSATTALQIQRQNADLAQEPQLNLRIGLHGGDVIQTKDDFFGAVVNKAARVAGAAAPCEIRTSDATRLMAGDAPDLVFHDAVETELRGFDGTHLLFRLDW